MHGSPSALSLEIDKYVNRETGAANGRETPVRIGRCVVVGGAGAVGQMFARLLVQREIVTTLVDLKFGGDAIVGMKQVIGDISRPDEHVVDELRAADLVLLAVPESVAIDCVKGVTSHTQAHTLIVNTCSVQVPISERMRGLEGDFEALGLNPMFGPSLDPSGRPIAAVVVRDGPRVQQLLSVLSETGAEVVLLSDGDHDRISAITQCATHAAVISFGLTLLKSDVSIDELSIVSPPPCMALLALLARMVSGVPEVYWDVQSANLLGAAMRRRLGESIALLSEKVESDDLESFESSFAGIEAFYGSRLADFAAIGQSTFTQMAPTAKSPNLS